MKKSITKEKILNGSAVFVTWMNKGLISDF